MRGFVLILLAGLGCAALGGAVGWLIGYLSPEFITFLVQPVAVARPEHLAAALGLLSGLLLGAGAMAFGLFIEVFRAWALRPRAAEAGPPPQVPQPPAPASFRSRSV